MDNISKYLGCPIHKLKFDIFALKRHSYLHKISTILSFDIKNFKRNINLFYNLFLYKHFKYDVNDIDARVDKYFRSQRTTTNINKIMSIINFQYIISTYCNELLSSIIQHVTDIDIRKTLTITSVALSENADIKDIVTNYIEQTRMEVLSTKVKNKKEEISEKLTLFISKIMPLILSYIHNEYVCYGSFTAFYLDSSITYDDIDLYHANAYKFLMFFMVIFNFTLDLNVYIFAIPFIPGHVSLKYNNDVIIDCIFLSNSIINTIPSIVINNVTFIDPGLQMLNNIRMGVELFRCNKINAESDNCTRKYCVLLNHMTQSSYFNQSRFRKILNKDIRLKYELSDGCLVIDLLDCCPSSIFNKAVIMLYEPKVAMKELSKLNGVFSRKFGAFLNEIFFESSIQGGRAIDEKDIINISRDFIPNIYVGDNNLYFTNYTTSVFINTGTVSYRNLLSAIATIALYNILHKRYEFGYDLYYVLLNLMKNCVKDDILEHNRIDRHKKKGKHRMVSMKKDYFQSVFNERDVDYEFAEYSTFTHDYGTDAGFDKCYSKECC